MVRPLMTFLLDSARKLLCLLLITTLTLLGQASAQQQPPPSAPVPAQILQAHTVFLANAGGDPYFAFFSGGPDRAYNDVYAGLKQWSRVTVVASPQQADLILEIRSRSNPSSSGGADPSPIYMPELELRLLDPSSHTTLWTLNSYLNGSLARQKTRDRTLDQAGHCPCRPTAAAHRRATHPGTSQSRQPSPRSDTSNDPDLSRHHRRRHRRSARHRAQHAAQPTQTASSAKLPRAVLDT